MEKETLHAAPKELVLRARCLAQARELSRKAPTRLSARLLHRSCAEELPTTRDWSGVLRAGRAGLPIVIPTPARVAVAHRSAECCCAIRPRTGLRDMSQASTHAK